MDILANSKNEEEIKLEWINNEDNRENKKWGVDNIENSLFNTHQPNIPRSAITVFSKNITPIVRLFLSCF